MQSCLIFNRRLGKDGTLSNQTLQATAVKRLGWQVGRQRPAVPELGRWAFIAAMRHSLVSLLLILLLAACASDPGSQVPGSLNTFESAPAAGRPRELSWAQALDLIASGRVRSMDVVHAGDVWLQTADGAEYHTIQPASGAATHAASHLAPEGKDIRVITE